MGALSQSVQHSLREHACECRVLASDITESLNTSPRHDRQKGLERRVDEFCLRESREPLSLASSVRENAFTAYSLRSPLCCTRQLCQPGLLI